MEDERLMYYILREYSQQVRGTVGCGGACMEHALLNSGVTDMGVRAAQHCTGHWDITQGTLMGRGEWVMTRGGGLIGTGDLSAQRRISVGGQGSTLQSR